MYSRHRESIPQQKYKKESKGKFEFGRSQNLNRHFEMPFIDLNFEIMITCNHNS